MTISVLSAARRLGQKSGWTLSNLEMQKLIYLAHMFYMGQNNGEPLVSGRFQAWDYGPVHPDLYHKAKVFGSSPVEDIFSSAELLEVSPERNILDEAYDTLGNLGPGRLVSITHREGGAWDKNYQPRLRGIVIPNEDILTEYQGLENV